ncbi:embigin isoform 2-T2 [Polymixia lowei]
MLVSRTPLSCQVLLLLLSWRGIDTTEEPGPTRPPSVPINPLSTDVRSVVIKGENVVEKVELLNPVNLELECNWTGNQNKLPSITGYWRKDGNEIGNLTVLLENDQYNLKRAFNITGEDGLGKYSCLFGDQAKADFILEVPQMDSVKDKPIVSYVGDSVVLTCKMEKPKPSTWYWYRANEIEKVLIDNDAENRRYKIKNEDKKTTLMIFNLTEADSGRYYCGAVYNISISLSYVELKVITFLEPLKPFIAIVVEVLVLVTIILLYERRTSKRRPVAGNGMNADQTNKLTQGDNSEMEESSTMRQRKV